MQFSIIILPKKHQKVNILEWIFASFNTFLLYICVKITLLFLKIADKYQNIRYNKNDMWNYPFICVLNTVAVRGVCLTTLEDELQNVQACIDSIINDNISINNAYEILRSFKTIWEQCVDIEKKELIRFLVEKVEIYAEERENGHFLKSVKLRFPLLYNGLECDTFGLDKDGHVETVCLMSRIDK